MMGKQRGKKILIGTAAVLMCMSGCSGAAEETTVPSTVQSQPAVTESAATENTIPSGTAVTTEPSGTEATVPGQTLPGRTDPSVDAGTTPTEDPVPQIDKLPAAQYQAVISRCVSALATAEPGCTYDSSWTGGSATPLIVSPGLSVEEMASIVVGQIRRDVFEGQSITCTYNLTYQGISYDGQSHMFQINFAYEKVEIEKPDFDGQAVAGQVTQNVLGRISGVSTFDGSGYKTCITISDIPLFYGTQEAVSTLTGRVVDEINSRNLLQTEITQFKIVFASEGDASYVFFLYLK